MTNYDIECEYNSTKKKLLDIMDNDEFQAYLKENEFEQLFKYFDLVKCQYYDENEFISVNRYFLHEYPKLAETWWWTSKIYK